MNGLIHDSRHHVSCLWSDRCQTCSHLLCLFEHPVARNQVTFDCESDQYADSTRVTTRSLELGERELTALWHSPKVTPCPLVLEERVEIPLWRLPNWENQRIPSCQQKSCHKEEGFDWVLQQVYVSPVSLCVHSDRCVVGFCKSRSSGSTGSSRLYK